MCRCRWTKFWEAEDIPGSILNYGARESYIERVETEGGTSASNRTDFKSRIFSCVSDESTIRAVSNWPIFAKYFITQEVNLVSMRRNWPYFALGGLGIVALALVLGFYAVRRVNETDLAGDPAGETLVVTSTSFSDGGAIPAKFTCDGSNLSPELAWSGEPATTRTVLIFADDPDAPLAFVHWIAFNLPSSTHELPEGASEHPGTGMPEGSKEGENGFGNGGYGGPCPPGRKPHRYVFSVYALDSSLNLPFGAKKGDLAAAIKGHVLAEGKIVGLYSRPAN